MMGKELKYSVVISILFAIAATASAQKAPKTIDVGLFLGCSYYIGELNTRHFSQFTQPAVGVMARRNFNSRFSLRLAGIFGAVEAYDEASNLPYKRQRNLDFKSDIGEVAITGEFNFLDFEIGNEKAIFSPYIFAGLGVFKFSPQGKLKDSWVPLQPLTTEGQGMAGGPKDKYKLMQVSIPFGVGVKIGLSKNLALGIEWGMRKTFTDYLDDVSGYYYDPKKLTNGEAAYFSDKSTITDPAYTNVGRQRGNPLNKDWYCFAGVSLCRKLNPKGNRCPGVMN